MALNRLYDQPVTPLPPGEPVVHMRGVTKVFHTAAGDFTVLKDVSVDVRQGEFVSVVGRSGSGKSTLANMLTGIDHPTGGTVAVGGVKIHDLPESRMAVWRGKNLGIVFQFFQLLPMLTLIENVMLPMDFCNIYAPASREERAMALLRRVGLAHMAHKLPGAAAGGQQQSAAVARALANDPPILIADEPTGNLDSNTAAEVMDLFDELVAQGKTILMVTHDPTLVRRTGRMLLISDGELVNEAVAGAFPDLPHPALLRLGKLAEPLNLPPGAPLSSGPLSSGPLAGANPPVYLVAEGELARAGGTVLRARQTLDPLAAGLDGWQAGPSGAVLLALPRAEAQPWLPHPAPASNGPAAAAPEAARAPRLIPWKRRLRRGP